MNICANKKFPGEIVDLLEYVKAKNQIQGNNKKDSLISQQTRSIDIMNHILSSLETFEMKSQDNNLKIKKLNRKIKNIKMSFKMIIKKGTNLSSNPSDAGLLSP